MFGLQMTLAMLVFGALCGVIGYLIEKDSQRSKILEIKAEIVEIQSKLRYREESSLQLMISQHDDGWVATKISDSDPRSVEIRAESFDKLAAKLVYDLANSVFYVRFTIE